MTPVLVDKRKTSDSADDLRARELVGRMTLQEKLEQMAGSTPLLAGLLGMVRGYNERPFPAGENLRLGVPALQFTDGPRGVAVGRSTCFPVAIARGASWDVGLEERIGEAIGVEARAQGANFVASVCINLLRHPAWGRAQETFGEDPYHLGEMGAAAVRGLQRHVMACVKHFAANSIDNTRFKVDVKMDERTLREVYLPHFKRCVDEGVASVMSAYNRLDGQRCGHHRRLLREILKEEWGFRGFVMSDFVFGVRGADAAAAGCDVEMPFRIYYGRPLRRALRRGRVSMADIDDAAYRIVREKLRFASLGEPRRYRPEVVACDAHRALAREAAQKSIVLLKNDASGGRGTLPLLPLDTATAVPVAVIGRLAAFANIGDRGSSTVRPPRVVTPLEGLRQALAGPGSLLYERGDRIDAAVAAARAAETAIVIVGYTHRDEGERIDLGYKKIGGDRECLTLRPRDEDLIAGVCRANPRTVVVLMGGSAIVTEAWRHLPASILMAWYPGMEGGRAIADILLGHVNPCAKLPVSFVRDAGHLPSFEARATTVEYDYLHGYRLLDRSGQEAAFPFGFGLSYTRFSYRDLVVSPTLVRLEHAEARVEVTVVVSNSGERDGEEIVQLYVGRDESAMVPASRVLRGFRKLRIAHGGSAQVCFELTGADFSHYDVERREWAVEPGRYRIAVGPSSLEQDLLGTEITIEAGQS